MTPRNPADRLATEPRTEELRRLLKAANVTEDRPWDLYCDHGRSVALEEHTIFGGHSDEDYGPCRITTGPEFDEHVHAELAVAAVNALPGLLALAEAAQGAAPLSPIGDNLADTIAERRARRGAIPATEAGRRLADAAHGLTRLDKPMSRDKARDLIRAEVFAIEAEAAQGAAPRAEGLLEAATALADATAAEHADCTSDHCHWCPLVDAVRAASRPSDERVPEEQD